MSAQRGIFDRENLRLDPTGAPLYEQLAGYIEKRISEGAFEEGVRLPTVRQLSADLELSGTTITAAFAVLSKHGFIRAEVGRGTFVTLPKLTASPRSREPALPDRPLERSRPSTLNPWRKRALVGLGTRLRRMFPEAMDCSTGRPDPGLLPVEIFRRAWRASIGDLESRDLQYANPEPIEALVKPVMRRLEAENVPARESDLIVANSAQELMMLALQVLLARYPRRERVVAVEEPGYPTIIDAYERMGVRLCGVAVDDHGAVPSSLEAALRAGAQMVLLTPRAHNPTGSSWSGQRLHELADVLAGQPDVIVAEDDQFGGIASAHAGSLLQDSRLEDRVIYIRSFSKSLGPDLRVAMGAARQPLRSALIEAKVAANGWTSRLLQRTVALMLADPEIDAALGFALASYSRRREAAAQALREAVAQDGVEVWPGQDGVNVWVQLSPGTDCLHVVEQAAGSGVLVALGEPFFLRPGHTSHIRFNAGAVRAEQAALAGKLLGEAIRNCEHIPEPTIHV